MRTHLVCSPLLTSCCCCLACEGDDVAKDVVGLARANEAPDPEPTNLRPAETAVERVTLARDR